MANQTLTSVNINYDDASISGLLNGDQITLNDSTLTINSDVRWGQQAAVFGSMTISSALGGKIQLDGRDVWWMPFDAGSGVVPALGTVNVNDVTGSVAGAGEFLGVFTALGTAPLAAAGAMPATGFIKFRKVTSAFVDNEIMTFTGALATVNSATGGQRGWIHVVGAEGGTFILPRLGEFNSIGDWFEIGTTNGADDQTFQFPVADYCPAMQVETAVGSGVYEWWLAAGSRWATATQFVSTDERGKYFGCDQTTGVITIAQRASNACGFKPVSGLRVRIPNIICSSSTAANWALNTINATAGSRYDFTTTTSGEVDISHIVSNWNISLLNAYAVSIQNSALLITNTVSNTATTTLINNCGVGLYLTQDFVGIILSNLFSGATVTDCRIARYQSTASIQNAFTATDCADVLIERVICETFGSATTIERGIATTYSFSLSRVSDLTMNDCGAICGVLTLTTCSNVNVNNHKFADKMNGTTSSTVGASAIAVQSSCSNVYFDGFSYLFPSIANLHPYICFFTINSSNGVYIKNIGTPSAPLDCGSANAAGNFITSTITKVLDIRRCYFDNMRLTPVSLANTVQDVVMDNLWTDGSDLMLTPALAINPRGCRWTNSQSPQSACYGRHWEDSFISTTKGNLLILGNEPLASTTSQVSITSGTPKFNSGGGIQMPTLGDEVVWEMPYFAIGHTKLGGHSRAGVVGVLMANMSYEYQIDTGAGFSGWNFLYTCRARASGGTVGTNTYVFTAVASGRLPQIGDYVGTALGTNLPDGTTVTNVVGTTVTLSNNFLVALSAAQGVYFWTDLEAEPSITPATGVKLKIRATTLVAAPTNQIQFIQIPTTTNSTDQQLQYPLPVTLNLASVSGIETGSRIRVYNVDTATEIANEVVSGTEWSLYYGEGSSFSAGDQIEIRLAKVDGLTAYLPQTIVTLATSAGWAALASQELDAVYNLNAIDGSTVTELSGDYPNVQIDSDDADGETTVQRIYAWFAYNQTTSQGIVDFFEAMVAEDAVNYRVRVTVANLKLDNTIATPLMVIGGRLYRDDGATVIAATSNSIQLDPDKAYAVSASGGAPTASEVADAVRVELTPELDDVVDIKSKTNLIPALL